jgi:hypothetical protein
MSPAPVLLAARGALEQSFNEGYPDAPVSQVEA